jgi:hypothetical protein
VFETLKHSLPTLRPEQVIKSKPSREKGGEYISNGKKDFFRRKGIHTEEICTDEDKQN